MTDNRILLPTERERKINYSYAWKGYGLDASIEEAEKRNSFFVSGFQFTEKTLRMLGIKPTVSTRQGINAAFDRANEAIAIAICEIQNREVS